MKLADALKEVRTYNHIGRLDDERNALIKQYIKLRDRKRDGPEIRITFDGKQQEDALIRAVLPAVLQEVRSRIDEVERKLVALGIDKPDDTDKLLNHLRCTKAHPMPLGLTYDDEKKWSHPDAVLDRDNDFKIDDGFDVHTEIRTVPMFCKHCGLHFTKRESLYE